MCMYELAHALWDALQTMCVYARMLYVCVCAYALCVCMHVCFMCMYARMLADGCIAVLYTRML